MNWIEIVMTVLGGTSVLGVVQAVRYRKQSKLLKDMEVKKTINDVQSERIDLGEKYLEKVLSLTERNFDAINDGNNRIDRRFDSVENKITNIEEFLNGEYKMFLKKRKTAY